jgi:hypothetical protein
MEYDAAYCNNLAQMYRDSAEAINGLRWDFVEPSGARLVLDYGCGCNYLTAYAPAGITVDSYDIGVYTLEVCPPTGIRHDHYDLTCLFDVLEHVDWQNAPDRLMLAALAASEYVAVTVPVPPPGTDLPTWKHYKPGEHLTYFSEASLLCFMAARGFLPLRWGQPECPPRQDIHSFLFRRVGRT